MLKLLLKKEWKEQIRSRFFNSKKNILSSILGLAITFGVIALIIFILNALNSRFIAYGVSKEVFTITIFAVMILEIALNINRVSNALYNVNESALILSLPLNSKDVVLSKVIILYINELLSMSVLLISIIVSFGLGSDMGAYYYITSFVLFLIVPLISLFVMIILSIPYIKVKRKISELPIVQLVFALVLIGVFFICYRYVINLFIGLVNQDRLAAIFNSKTAELLQTICKYVVPANVMVNILFQEKIIVSVLVVLVVLAVAIYGGLFTSTRIYQSMLRKQPHKARNHNSTHHLTSAKKSLYKKELITLFRSSNFLFSYITILLLLPLISYIIAGEMKLLVERIFGERFFLPFVMMIVAMFASMINGFGSLVISREGNHLRTLKTLPVHFKVQVQVKLNITLCFALASILVTAIVLGMSDILSAVEAVGVFLVSAATVTTLITMLVKYDLKHPNIKEKDSSEGNGSLVSIMYSLFVPIIICVAAVYLVTMFEALIVILIISVILLFIAMLSYNSLTNSAVYYFRKIEV